jgi:hypothetical protein
MICTYEVGCVGTDVPVLVASFVMVVESTRLRIPEVLNLHHYHFEKPKSRKFFPKMYADINNGVRFSMHMPWWSRQEDLIIWNFGVRLSDYTGLHPRTGSLHKLLFLLEIQLFWNVCALSTGQEFAGLRRTPVTSSLGPSTPRTVFSWEGHKM